MGKKNKLFPIKEYCHSCVINESGDITIALATDYQPAFTRSLDELIRDHLGRVKAFLPVGAGVIVNIQHRFFPRYYVAPSREGPPDELEQASDRHFDQRLYFDQESYLTFTITGGSFGEPLKMIKTLTRKNLIPLSAKNEAILQEFRDWVEQVKMILQYEAGIGCRYPAKEELMGTRKTAGLTEANGLLAELGSKTVLEDFDTRNGLQVGEKHVRFLAISDASLLPSQCSPTIRYDGHSTDKTCYSVPTGSYFGGLLRCPHIYNLYLVIQDRAALLKELEKRLRRLESLGGKDSVNLATQDDIRAYREVLSKGEQQAVRMHANLIIWADTKAELAVYQQQVVANASKIGVDLHLETLTALQLYDAAILGNAGELPMSHTLLTFAQQACCFAVTESWEKDCPGPSSIRFVDRMTGRPILVDLYDQPKRKGLISNFHKVVVGPSGSGKSVWLLMLVLAAYRQGHHVMIMDIGSSFKRLCRYLGARYFDFGDDQALQFNPFLLGEGETLDTEKTESLITLLLILWKMAGQAYTRSEYIAVSNIVTNYYAWLDRDAATFPCFDSLYEWLQEQYIPGLQISGVREKEFDWTNFLYVLRPYYRGGEYERLLNAQENMNLLQERFVVFELDKIPDNLFSVVTVILMELYISKLRKLKGVRKLLVMDEVWKALMTPIASEFVKWAYKTGRKFNGEVIVATQDIEDLIGNAIVKNAIINNADTKIILDAGKLMNRFDEFQAAMGLTDKDKTMVLSLNRVQQPGVSGKEFFVMQGNGHSRVYRLELSMEELMLFTSDEPQRIKIEEYTSKHHGLWEGIKALAADVRSGAVKWVVIAFLAMGGMLLPNGGAKAQIIDIADEIIKEALETADLKIQRLQTQTLLLQNAEKALENTMAGDLLDDITGWVQQQDQLFAEYYGELWQVKAALTGFSRVAQLIERQAQLVKEYQRVTAAVRQDPHFSAAEVTQMLNVYSGILNASIRNTQQLALVIQGSMTQMEDAGRLRIIDETATNIDHNYSALEQYNQENTLLSLQRAKDEADIQTIKTLYGIQ
jgi:conjugation system TraG family ATPase